MATNDFDPQLKSAFSDYLATIQKSDTRKLDKAFFEKMSFFEQAEKFAKNCFSGTLKLDKIPQPAKTLLRVHNLLLSDLHIGSDISGDETGQIDFKRTEEARRLAHVIRETVRYKPQYRKNTALAVNLLGDIIENMMHDARTGAVMAEQVCRAVHLLRQGLLYLCMHYSKIDVYCATGNHDRRTSRHPKRAVHQKFDSYATIIYYALKESFAHIPNITFHIPKCPISHYDVFGRKLGFSHGDNVIAPLSPYSNINVKALEHSVNNINGALPDKERLAAIMYGHCLTRDHSVNVFGLGWVAIADICKGYRVLSYHAGHNEWARVTEKTKEIFSGNMMTVGNTYWTQTITPNHHMYTSDGRYININELMKTDTPEAVPLSALPAEQNGEWVDNQVPLEENLLRVIIAVCADGSFDKNGNLRFHLKKGRKIERLNELLCKAGYTPTWSAPSPRDTYKVSIVKASDLYKQITRYVNRNSKVLPDCFFHLPTRLKEILIEEIVKWDGSTLHGTNFQFSSFKFQEINLIQSVLNELGYKSARPRCNLLTFNLDRGVVRHNGKTWKLENRSVINEPVFCLTTEFHNFWVRNDVTGQVSLTGNTHTGHIVHLKNGTVLIGNGGLPPAGPFDVSLGNFQTNNGQILFESVPNHPVGDVRFIRCDAHTDKDKSLDKIIAPWQEF